MRYLDKTYAFVTNLVFFMETKRVIILGAGISGLSLAWFLKQKFKDKLKVSILEKEARAGGWIKSVRKRSVLLEKGPRGFRPKGKGEATLALCKQLGIEDKIVFASPLSKKRFILHKKSLVPLPHDFFSFLNFPFKGALLSSLIKDLGAAKGQREDLSVKDFFNGQISEVLVKKLVDPFFSGIYAGDIQKSSAESCFPGLFQDVQKNGSFFKSFRKKEKEQKNRFSTAPLLSFKDGMEQLVESLKEGLSEELELNKNVVGVSGEDEKIKVLLEEEELLADYVVSTLPLPHLLPLLDEEEIALSLKYSSLRVLSLLIERESFPKRLQGFGYLIPSEEGVELLGTVFDSFVFPAQDPKSSLIKATLMFGGSRHFERVKKLSEDELFLKGVELLNKHLKANLKVVDREFFTAKEAIAQYPVGYKKEKERFLDEMKNKMPNFFIQGTSFNGVAVNDCVFNSRHFAENFLTL
ncbi:Protoporphyrinogen oxidase [Chlamydiales bacterium SCGC AB-751-O23]|nr:Protoporphyrinogen oxidase [Chlamydiales bacterium SCGC AB-751-O23]